MSGLGDVLDQAAGAGRVSGLGAELVAAEGAEDEVGIGHQLLGEILGRNDDQLALVDLLAMLDERRTESRLDH